MEGSEIPRAAASGRAGWFRGCASPPACWFAASGDSPRSQRAGNAVPRRRRRRCAELRRTYHSIQEWLQHERREEAQQVLLPTPEACTAQANKNSSPATNTFSVLAAQGLGQLLREARGQAPRRGAGEPGDPRNPGAKNGAGGRAGWPGRALLRVARAARGAAGAP